MNKCLVVLVMAFVYVCLVFTALALVKKDDDEDDEWPDL